VHAYDTDLDVGVSLQHAIFGGALLKIVAAAGDASLPLCNGVTNSDGGVDVDAEQALSTSLHATQVWTLADASLSQRCVLFTHKGDFFCCRQEANIWLDGNVMTIPGKRSINRIPGPVDSILPCLASYIQLSQSTPGAFSPATVMLFGPSMGSAGCSLQECARIRPRVCRLFMSMPFFRSC
jgi:hypothetical protein